MTFNKPKVLSGLNQNGKRSGVVFEYWATMDFVPPAERRVRLDLRNARNRVSPTHRHAVAGKPGGALMVWEVKESRKSECNSVMELIQVGTSPDVKASPLLLGH